VTSPTRCPHRSCNAPICVPPCLCYSLKQVKPRTVGEEAGSILRPLRLTGVAVFCCLLTIFAMAVKPVTDPDFWWHLATGRYMAGAHVIPHYDLYSLTAQSHAWIAHEWLTELLFYAGWVSGGAKLLMLASAGVITLTFGIVYLAARERGAPAFISAAVVALAALASAPTWGTTPPNALDAAHGRCSV